MAAEKPSITAPIIQRTGHGKALRTAIRGALMVRRRRNRRSFKAKRGVNARVPYCARNKKAAERGRSGFFRAAKINAC
jgi:hypothetical protein